MRSSQFDAITTSVWYNEDDRVWEWEVKIGQSFERSGTSGTRKDALDKSNDCVEAAL